MKGRFDDKIFVNAVTALNKHLPAERKTLLALLNEDKPAVQGRDGSSHRIKREELEALASLIPEEDRGKLRLPIYIELTPDYGRGMAKVHGKQDCKIVKRILEEEKEGNEGNEGNEEQDGDDREEVTEMFINRDAVRRIRRKLPTATEYAFFYSTSF